MSPAEASGTKAPKEPADSVLQDAAKPAPHDGTGLLLRTMLEHHPQLGLDSAQIAELSRLYWSVPLPAAADAIDMIEPTLSPEQFRQGVTYFLTATAGEAGPETQAAADIGGLVKAAVDERIRDKDAITVDLAARAADRLMAWMRMFGLFVAVPVAIVLAMLSFFGISKFQDVRDAGTKADATLLAAQQKLDNIAQRSTTIDNQIAALDQRIAANDKRIDSLDTTVQNLAERLSFGAAADLPGSRALSIVFGVHVWTAPNAGDRLGARRRLNVLPLRASQVARIAQPVTVVAVAVLGRPHRTLAKRCRVSSHS